MCQLFSVLVMNSPWRRSAVRALTRTVVVVLAATCVQAGTSAVAAADPSYEAWKKLRMCESSDRYSVNTGTGYYGAYQFDLATWRSVGGEGRPDLASPKEQDFRALYLYRMRGWQPWECANADFLNLKNDSDARSKRVPSYAEAAYIGGGGEPAEPSPTPPPESGPAEMPPWPGVVYAYGDCARELRDFQLRMNAFDLGYRFSGSGCSYEQTRKAVLALQRANDIKDSGRLGPKTWKAAWRGNKPQRTG